MVRGTLRNVDGSVHDVAIKVLKRETPESVEDFRDEAAIMGGMKHNHIVELLGVCFTDHPKLILLELCADGSLEAFLLRHQEAGVTILDVGLSQLLSICLDTLLAMIHLESNRLANFVHCTSTTSVLESIAISICGWQAVWILDFRGDTH